MALKSALKQVGQCITPYIVPHKSHLYHRPNMRAIINFTHQCDQIFHSCNVDAPHSYFKVHYHTTEILCAPSLLSYCAWLRGCVFLAANLPLRTRHSLISYDLQGPRGDVLGPRYQSKYFPRHSFLALPHHLKSEKRMMCTNYLIIGIPMWKFK